MFAGTIVLKDKEGTELWQLCTDYETIFSSREAAKGNNLDSLIASSNEAMDELMPRITALIATKLVQAELIRPWETSAVMVTYYIDSRAVGEPLHNWKWSLDFDIIKEKWGWKL